MKIMIIAAFATLISNFSFAETPFFESDKSTWTKTVFCGDNLVIDRNELSSYQIVLKNDLADFFSSVRERNPVNSNEIVIGNVAYYGPHGCSIPEMQKQTFVEWNNIGNSAVKIINANSLSISIQRGSLKVIQELHDCSIPDWMYPQ